MSNMISAWLAGYVGVMARRKIISASKEYHRMHWQIFENITDVWIWSKITCPQSWWKTLPSLTTPSLSFKMESQKIQGKRGFGWICFLLLFPPSKGPEAKTLLLLKSKKIALKKPIRFPACTQKGQQQASTGWAEEGTKEINLSTLIPHGTYTKHCHYKLKSPLEYCRRCLDLKVKVRLFSNPLWGMEVLFLSLLSSL